MKRSIVKQLAEIQALPMDALKERWRALYGTEPPVGNRAYVVRRLCHRVQELAYGGISDATRERLRDVAAKDRLCVDPNGNGPRPRPAAKPGLPVSGTTFIREWHGEKHVVTAIDGGFEYRGRRYRSLSAIARAITGSHWNGPLFFGIRTRARRKS